MAQPVVKTSFASGEWAPKLRSRVDIQKYHAGASLLRNFYVDYSGGGASTRNGTQFIAQTGANGARLIPFQPSTNTSYVLEFGNFYIRFYTNGAQVLSGGLPYQISSPFAASDLFPNPNTGNPGIKFVQDVASLIICHPSYSPQILTLISATNWTITAINFASTLGAPTNLAVVSTDTGGTTWYYGYLVTAVDMNGQESAPPTPVVFAGTNYIGDSTHEIANTVSWTAVAGASSYNVYKASPSFKATPPAGAPYGFIANVTGTSFIESFPGIGADFSQTPPIVQNPFSGSSVASYTVTVHGSYTTVPTVSVTSGGGTGATAIASLGITSSTLPSPGTGYVAGHTYALIDAAAGTTWAIITVNTIGGGGAISTYTVTWPGSITTGSTPANNLIVNDPTGPGTGGRINATWGVLAVDVVNGGEGYTSAPTVAFSAGAAAATAVLNSAVGSNPGVPGFYQERLALGGLVNNPQGFDLSQPGSFFNFNTSNPVQPDDAISGTIISENLNDIRSFTSVPTGLLAMTGRTSWLINGGGGLSTQVPITPSNATAIAQSFSGANDMPPLKVQYDALYVTNKGNYVRQINYNIWNGIFIGADVSVLSNHLFFGYYLVDWCWAEEPFKTVWATRSDGTLLSLGYVKEQELIGWAHHDTNGQFKSVASVYETVNGNVVDAVYTIVERVIGNSIVQYVERFKDRFFTYGYEDSWSVDCALQIAASTTSTNQLRFNGDGSVIGNAVGLTDQSGAGPFTAPMATNNWFVRANGGVYKITGFISANQVTATVVRVSPNINTYTFSSGTNVPQPANGYTIWAPVSSVSGLTQLAGQTVTGVIDGAVCPPTVVSGGGVVTLPFPGTKITLGLAFTPQLQTLPIDTGTPTIQSKRKKLPAATLRVADTLGLQIGTSFAKAVTMKDFQIGAIPSTSNGITSVTDLYSGDGRTILDQLWQEFGVMSIQQNLPYPATILGVFPELEVGDTAK